MEEKLILENIKLIYYVIHRYKLHKQIDEYFDIGMIGLIKGVKTYNKDKNVAISTYLTKCISNEIMHYKRDQAAKKRGGEVKTVSLYTPVNNNEEDKLLLVDTIQSNIDIEKSCIDKETMSLIYEEISKLNKRDRYIIYSTYGLGNYKQKNQIQLSKEIGITQSSVSRVLTKFLNDMRDKLGGEKL